MLGLSGFYWVFSKNSVKNCDYCWPWLEIRLTQLAENSDKIITPKTRYWDLFPLWQSADNSVLVEVFPVLDGRWDYRFWSYWRIEVWHWFCFNHIKSLTLSNKKLLRNGELQILKEIQRNNWSQNTQLFIITVYQIGLIC